MREKKQNKVGKILPPRSQYRIRVGYRRSASRFGSPVWAFTIHGCLAFLHGASRGIFAHRRQYRVRDRLNTKYLISLFLFRLLRDLVTR